MKRVYYKYGMMKEDLSQATNQSLGLKFLYKQEFKSETDQISLFIFSYHLTLRFCNVTECHYLQE